MLMRSVLFLFLLTVLQVTARYKSVEPGIIDNLISHEPPSASSASRIVSGWEAQPGQLPHHAALRMVDPTGGIRQCGGSIVSKEWVITSGFCTATRILGVVRAGVVSLINPEYIFETTEWYTHPKYDPSLNLQPYDIALVKLQRPLVYTTLVKPIRVQSSADAYRDYDGEQVYASGHGRTETFGPNSDVLRWVYLRAISNRACSGTWTGVYDTTICARYYNVTSQNTCFGDNGGPLVHVGSDGVPTLIGVSYFFPSTSQGCHSGLPSGFTRTGPFLPWFEEVTGIDFENQQEDVDDTTMADTTTTSTTPTFTSPTTDNTTYTTLTSVPTTPDYNFTSTTSVPTTPDSNATTTTVVPTTPETNFTTTTSVPTSPEANFTTTTPDSTTPETNVTSITSAPTTPEANITTTPLVPTTPEANFTTTTSAPTTPEANITTTTLVPTTPDTNITATTSIPTTPEANITTTPLVPTSPEANFTTTSPDSTTPEANITSTTSVPATPEANITTTPLVPTSPEANFTTTSPDSTAPEANITSTTSVPATPEANITTTPLVPTSPEANLTTTTSVPIAPEANFTTTPIPTIPDANFTTATIPTTPSATTPYTPTTTESEDFTPTEEITTDQPESSEEEEEGDSGCSDPNENDEIGQLLKRLIVDVTVKVRLNKYNTTQGVGNEISLWK